MIRLGEIESPEQFARSKQFCRQQIVQARSRGQLGFCFGAGASFSATNLSWAGLINACLADAKLPKVDQPWTAERLVAGAESFKRSSGDRYFQKLRDVLYRESTQYLEAVKSSSPGIDLLIRSKNQPGTLEVLCFNYDSFIEDSIIARGLSAYPVVQSESHTSDFAVLHAHGYISPEKSSPVCPLVFAESEYEQRRMEATPHDKVWNSNILQYFKARFTVVLGIGGAEDIWQLPVHILLEAQTPRNARLMGVWFVDERADRAIIDRISKLGFVPLRFNSIPELNSFLMSVVF